MKYKTKYRMINKYIFCKKLFKNTIQTILLICCWLTVGMSAAAAPGLQDVGDKLVIVIDPGHGGENEGTTSGAHKEKIMTLTTAQAMYEELRQFDNVEVYMTRTDDKDLSLKERAEFASAMEADFLFSIHYNASEYHTMFGSEVWVSCQPPYNAYGYQFGYMQMLEMQDMGLFLRGVKTRINDEGTDYYGVIRHAASFSVPAVIIEHCYVDESRDIPFCDTEEDWIAFGKADARAVAKYFGLSSTSLGIDYTAESNQLPEVNEDVRVKDTIVDSTSPDVCMLELSEADYDTGKIDILVSAADYDSPLIYYDYSIDGGLTYTPLIEWPGLDMMQRTYSDTFLLSIKVESGVQPEIILRAYNFADLYTESNKIPFLQTFYYDESAKESVAEEATYESVKPQRHSAGTITFTPAMAEEEAEAKEVSIFAFLQICLVFVVILLAVVLISQAINYRRRKKRRRQRMKEFGNNANHNK